MNKYFITSLISAILICLSFQVSARIITVTEAAGIVADFRSKQELPLSRSLISSEIKTTPVFCQKSSVGEAGVYVFNNEGGGFYLIAASDKVANPVLGYSNTGSFSVENIPDNMRAWIENYADEVQYIEQAPLSVMPGTRASADIKSVKPLLNDINYNQDAPYNNLCPMKGNNRTVTGCVATALAQVMRYYKYPEVGRGEHSYSWNGQTLAMNFAETPFDWDNMLPDYSEVNATDEQELAVATLMYAVGVSCDMQYDVSSGAVTATAVGALVEYFKYSKTAHALCHDVTPTTEFEEAIRNDLYANRPVIYTGRTKNAGHCFVVDGCDTQGYFHVNWGWGGVSNGYFLTTAMDPYMQGIGGSDGAFNLSQQIFLGIQPATQNEDSIQSEGYLICQGDFTPSVANVKPGKPIQLTFTNLFSYDVFENEYYIGWAMCDAKTDDYVAGEFLIASKLPAGYGWTSISLQNCLFPENPIDGDYKLYPIYTIKSKPDQYKIISMNKSKDGYIKVFVRDGVYYFNEYVKPPEPVFNISNITITGELEVESALRIIAVTTCNVKQENDFYSGLQLAFINETDSNVIIKSTKTTRRKIYTTGALLQFEIQAPADSGVYRFALIDADDVILSVSTDTYKISGKSLGVCDTFVDAGISISPVQGGIYVETTSPSNITVYSSEGVKVRERRVSDTETIHVTPGKLYIVVCQEKGLTKKLIVQ